jgi:WD40 repeat protein
MDTITSLTVSSNYLISGSKDKNLKLWSLDGSSNNIKCTTHAFNDYINTLDTDKMLPIFYAGSRDGQIKVATICDDKIKFIGGIIAHTQSISSVCSVSKRSNGMFLTGSTDKTVKIWKPDAATL